MLFRSMGAQSGRDVGLEIYGDLFNLLKRCDFFWDKLRLQFSLICPVYYHSNLVTSQIAGVDIMDLEDATKVLWKHGIYAENGMGCTGPIILVNKVNKDKAKEILKAEGLLS